MILNITLDCTECQCRKLQIVDLLQLGRYEPREEGKGRNKKLVYSGICRGCETALAGAEPEEMESRESWIEQRRKEQHGD